MRVGHFQQALVTARLGEFGLGTQVILDHRMRGQIHLVEIHQADADPQDQHIGQKQQHHGIQQPLPILLARNEIPHQGAPSAMANR